MKRHHKKTLLSSLAIMCFVCATIGNADTSKIVSEANLRAAMIVAILRFANQQYHYGAEYPICLLDGPPSAEKLLGSNGATVGERKLLVQQLTSEAPLKNCAAAVTGPELTKDQLQKILQQANQFSTILICDDCQNESLSHVALRRQNERIVFTVNIELAQQGHISFSSKMLMLAE